MDEARRVGVAGEGMGNDKELHGQEGSAGTGERLSAMKPPTSPMSQRTPSRGRGLHVDVSRLSQSAGALDSTHPPLYSPLASPFAPDLSTVEVGARISYLPSLCQPGFLPILWSCEFVF